MGVENRSQGEEKRKNGCREEKKWVRRREIVLWGHCSTCHHSMVLFWLGKKKKSRLKNIALPPCHMICMSMIACQTCRDMPTFNRQSLA